LSFSLYQHNVLYGEAGRKTRQGGMKREKEISSLNEL